MFDSVSLLFYVLPCQIRISHYFLYVIRPHIYDTPVLLVVFICMNILYYINYSYIILVYDSPYDVLRRLQQQQLYYTTWVHNQKSTKHRSGLDYRKYGRWLSVALLLLDCFGFCWAGFVPSLLLTSDTSSSHSTLPTPPLDNR